MAYNHGREDRKWRIWKEAEEKLLRECGVDEATIEQIRMADRADFNSNRRFYRWTNDVAEYLEDMAGRERQAEVGTVAELLEEIESENLYQVLVTVDGRTLKIVLLKMQGYSTKEIAPLVHLTTDEYVEFEKLLDEAGINAWREQVDFLGRGDGMIEHIWCEYGIDKRRFSV